jgi:hypothetical protein
MSPAGKRAGTVCLLAGSPFNREKNEADAGADCVREKDRSLSSMSRLLLLPSEGSGGDIMARAGDEGGDDI